MRIDKYLWCVRLFKTRSLATRACDGEKIRLNDLLVKSSKDVKEGDRIAIKVAPIWRTFKVRGIPPSRVGAKLVPEYMHETTTEKEMEDLDMVRRMHSESRQAGVVGRPTKRHRRDLDKFKGR